MRNIINLIKINFINIFKGMFGYGKKTGRRFFISAIVIFALLYFTFGNLMDTFMQYFVALNSPNYIFFVGALLSFAFVLFFITYESQNYFFKTKDFDILSALPLKNSEIVIAKYTSVLLSAYIYSSLIIFPTIVVYFLYTPFSMPILLLQILAFIFIPLVPMALGTLLGLLISFLTSKLKHSNTITIILFLLLFVAYFVMFFYMNNFATQIVAGGDTLINSMQYYLPSIAWYFKGFVDNEVLYLFLFMLFSIVMTSIVLVCLTLLYKKINYALIKKKLPKYKKAYSFKQKSSIVALFNIEAKRYFSTPMYVLNSGFSLLFMLIVPIILKVSLQSFFDISQGISVSYLLNILVLLNAMFAGMSNTTYASISIEGKQINMLKSLPLKSSNIFFAKILFNIALSLPFILLSNIITIILFFNQLDWFLTLMLFVVPILSLLAFSTLGLVLNLYLPKFDYDNINQIIKQSITLIIIIVFDIIVAFAPMFLINYFQNIFIVFGIVIFAYLIIFLTSLILLKTKGENLYNKLHY